MNLTLTLLEGTRGPHEWVEKPFEPVPGFSNNWWTGSAKGPLVFCSFAHETYGEVARAQVRPASTVGEAYPTWDRPREGASEIDLFEVRIDLQGNGIGHDAVPVLLTQFPPPVIALSLDRSSERFWRSLGWAEHAQPDAADYHPEGPKPAALFVWPG